jgi:mono/diheme cytochrome c family protein
MQSYLSKTIGCLTLGLTMLTLSVNAQNRTVWDGVFSEEQAQRGRTSYNVSCSGCHRPDLSGFEGALRGQKFVDHWREDSLESLYSNIKKSMPRNNPGSLEPATYVDIVAYILQQNDFPVGASELKSDALKDIQVTGKDGAEPLPGGALVQTYGCVKEDPAGVWVVQQATYAVRTRNPDKSSDADLKAAEARLPGKATYRLVDATFYHPERYKNHMVEAKGFLISDPSEGINPTSLAALSNSCQ